MEVICHTVTVITTNMAYIVILKQLHNFPENMVVEHSNLQMLLLILVIFEHGTLTIQKQYMLSYKMKRDLPVN